MEIAARPATLSDSGRAEGAEMAKSPQIVARSKPEASRHSLLSGALSSSNPPGFLHPATLSAQPATKYPQGIFLRRSGPRPGQQALRVSLAARVRGAIAVIRSRPEKHIVFGRIRIAQTIQRMRILSRLQPARVSRQFEVLLSSPPPFPSDAVHRHAGTPPPRAGSSPAAVKHFLAL